MSSSETPLGKGAGAAPVAYNIAAIVLTVALAGVGLAYLIDGATRGTAPAAVDGTLVQTIGGRELDIPRGWFRHADQQNEGFVKQVDLQLMLPLGAEGALRPIEVTLLQPSRVRPSARLLDGVYLHRFDDTQVSGPPGLVGKPLHGAAGFEGETVWYDALSPEPFVAKCDAAIVPGAASRCIRTVHLGPGLAAVYAFDAEVLENWKRFDPELRQRLEAIGIY
jgi:hypothetical protein